MTASPRRCDVLIVGAGPTGLALGIRLRQLGVDCLLVDQLEAPLPWSRALGLHARTLEILDAMGVLEAVRASSVVQRAVQVHNESEVVLELDLTTLEAPFPWVLSCPQATVEQILQDRYEQLGGRLMRQVELLDFRQDNQRVSVRLRDIQADQAWQLEAGVLVGCDGAHSRVRKALGISFDGVQYPDHFLLADLDIDWSLSPDSSHVFLLPEGVLVALPLPHGWRLILNQPMERETDYDQPDLSPFQERLQHALREPPRLAQPRWLSRFSVHRRLASQYRVNRVFLAGDACHIQSPLGAQGMNTGIADAFNLAWKLDLFLRGYGGGRLLDSYQQERRPVANTMLHSVDLLSRASLAKNRLLRAARDSMLRIVNGRPGMHRRVLRRASQLDVNYRSSARVAEGPAAQIGRLRGPRAGDRFPCMPLSLRDVDDTLSTQFLLGNARHHLIVQLPAYPAPAQVVATYALADRIPGEFGDLVSVLLVIPDADVPELDELREFNVSVAVDQGEHWAQLSDAGGLWLLRPDGHLGYRGTLADADHLIQWLKDTLRRRQQ